MPAFRVFCVVWGFSELIHAAALWPSREGPLTLGLAAFASLLIMYPTRQSLLAMAVFGVIHVGIGLPYLPNHVVFSGFVNLTIALAIVVTSFRPDHASSENDCYAIMAAVLRIELILLYVIAILHKLNTDFLDPDVSCAVTMLGDVTARFSLAEASGILGSVAIWMTLIVEFAIPLLLIIRKTRIVGILVGSVAHFVLALHPNPGIYSFSALMFAMFLPFIPAETIDAAYNRIERLPWSWSSKTFKAVGIAGMIALAAFRLGWFGWIGLSAIFLAFVLYAAAVTGPSPETRPVQLPRRSAWLVGTIPLSLIVLNGFAPYLGLQTTGTLSMFSNLRTEGGVTNHLIIPIKTQLFGYQDDLVDTISSTHPYFEELATNARLLPYVEYYRRVSVYDPDSLDYVRAGKRHSVRRSGSIPAASRFEPPDLFALHFFGFRVVDSEGPTQCRW